MRFFCDSAGLCFGRSDVDEFTSFFTGGEHNCAIDKSIQSVIFTDTYIQSGVVLGTTLTFQNVAGFAVLAAVNFDAEAFAF